jgi:hypothetical protein
VLGIYLTSSIEKLITPIEELIKNKRNMETNSRYY